MLTEVRKPLTYFYWFTYIVEDNIKNTGEQPDEGIYRVRSGKGPQCRNFHLHEVEVYYSSSIPMHSLT